MSSSEMNIENSRETKELKKYPTSCIHDSWYNDTQKTFKSRVECWSKRVFEYADGWSQQNGRRQPSTDR